MFKLSAGASGSNVIKVSDATEACRLIDRMFGPGIYDGHIYGKPNPATLSRWQRFKWFTRRCKAATRYAVDGRPIGVPGRRWLLEKGYAYFQEFIPHEYETWITVVGDRAWGKLRFPYPDDFRASRDGRVSIIPETIDSNLVSKAFEIAGKLESNSMAIDFLFKDREAVISELSYTFGGDSTPYPGNWNLQWIETNMKRAEAQVKAFLTGVCSGPAICR